MFLCIYGAKQKSTKATPMFAKDHIMGIFFKLDEFWKKFSRFSPKCIGQTDRKKRHYPSGYRCLKHFNLNEESASIKFLLFLPSKVAALWDGSTGLSRILSATSEANC